MLDRRIRSFVFVVCSSLILLSPGFGQSAPVISGLSPTSGIVGTEVTISGSGFGASGTVSFNWTPAQVQSWSDTQVTATVPKGATTGGVRVVSGGVTSNGVTFTLPNPQIASTSRYCERATNYWSDWDSLVTIPPA